VRIGSYEIVSALGAGGMGEVYRARDSKLKRDVAVKVLPDQFAHDADRLGRFQREAELLASVNHPNIAAVYGLEQSDGLTAIVLELVEGLTLAEVLQREAGSASPGLQPDQALPIARQIAEALEAAHDKGIVHRDLKPANIKITPDGKVKVLDFGLAKMLEDESPVSSLTMSPTLSVRATHAGVILGTAAYMSPEQARGKPVDRRTDIWAFGCVLFEMLSGRSVFDAGETVSDAIAEILKNEPRWELLGEDTPPHIRKLLRRCLQKDPQKRLPHIGLARIEIDEGGGDDELTGQRVTAAPPVVARPSLWKRAVPVVGAALVVGGMAAALAWRFKPAEQTPVTRFSMPLPDGQAFTNAGRQVVAISPDGKRFVYVANSQLYLRSMSETEARPIVGTQNTPSGVLNPVFSPDGEWIAFVWGGPSAVVKKISIAGGVPVELCPAGFFGMSWGVEGILFGQPGGIARISAAGGKPALIVEVKADETAYGPQMLPDGQHVLFTLVKGTDLTRWDHGQVVVQNLRTGERRVVIEGGSDARYVSTGHLVYAVGGTVFAQAFNAKRLETAGGPFPVIEGVRRANNSQTGAAQFSVSSNGSLMYWPGPLTGSSSGFELIWLDRKGNMEALKVPPRAFSAVRVSPDGKRIAAQIDDEKVSGIWIYELSGQSPMRRLDGNGNNRFPVWSSDSEHVAFQSDRDGALAIYWQRADGTETARALTKPEAGEAHVPDSWALKGDRFSYEVMRDNKTTLWTFSMADKKGTRFGNVTSEGFMNSTFSPDGRFLAYNVRDASAGTIYVEQFPATTTGARIPIGKEQNPFWSFDGKELLYSVGPNVPLMSVDATNAPRFGNPVEIPRPGLRAINALDGPRLYDIAPDGRILGIRAVARAEQASSQLIEVVLGWFEELKQKARTN
jgi:serine/threonine-protein kinase